MEKGAISSKNLTVWREQEIQLKWKKKGSRAVIVGWDYNLKENNEKIDKMNDSLLATYSIELETPITHIDSSSVLVFSMAESTESSNPKSKGKWINNNEKEEADEVDKEETPEEKENDDDGDNDDEQKEPLDLSISLKDSTGQVAHFNLSKFSALQREIMPVLWKMDFLTGDTSSEQVFQLFNFPLSDVKEINPNFNPSSIKTIKFIFDKSENGVVVIDNIGFMKSF